MGDGWNGSCVFALTPNAESPEWAKPIDIQMFECHIDHGIQYVVVFAYAVWMKSAS